MNDDCISAVPVYYGYWGGVGLFALRLRWCGPRRRQIAKGVSQACLHAGRVRAEGGAFVASGGLIGFMAVFFRECFSVAYEVVIHVCSARVHDESKALVLSVCLCGGSRTQVEEKCFLVVYQALVACSCPCCCFVCFGETEVDTSLTGPSRFDRNNS